MKQEMRRAKTKRAAPISAQQADSISAFAELVQDTKDKTVDGASN